MKIEVDEKQLEELTPSKWILYGQTIVSLILIIIIPLLFNKMLFAISIGVIGLSSAITNLIILRARITRL
jgi:hypothetical protein